MTALRHILDPQTEKRGGKSLHALAQPLIQSLRDTSRPHLPALFVKEPVNRLESGVRYTRVEKDRDYAKRYRTEDRNRIIGQTMFVNVQEPGFTFAITGPWNALATI